MLSPWDRGHGLKSDSYLCDPALALQIPSRLNHLVSAAQKVTSFLGGFQGHVELTDWCNRSTLSAMHAKAQIEKERNVMSRFGHTASNCFLGFSGQHSGEWSTWIVAWHSTVEIEPHTIRVWSFLFLQLGRYRAFNYMHLCKCVFASLGVFFSNSHPGKLRRIWRHPRRINWTERKTKQKTYPGPCPWMICSIYPSEISCCVRPNSTWQAPGASRSPNLELLRWTNMEMEESKSIGVFPYWPLHIWRDVPFYVWLPEGTMYIYIYINIHMRRTPSYMYANRDIHVAHCSTNFKDAKLIRTFSSFLCIQY